MKHTEHRHRGEHTHHRHIWHGRHGGLDEGFGRGHHRGSSRIRRMDSADLRLLLLRLLEDQPRHGYDIIREIEGRTGGAYVPSPGMIYPALTLLEEQDHIAAASTDGPKRLFSLTETGKTYLDANRAIAEAGLARLDALRGDAAPIDTGPVRRAMQNLFATLQQRLAGTQDKQIVFDAAGLIDEAARKIERL